MFQNFFFALQLACVITLTAFFADLIQLLLFGRVIDIHGFVSAVAFELYYTADGQNGGKKCSLL